jgi:hypothetical protein
VEGLSGSSTSDDLGATSVPSGDPAAPTPPVYRVPHDGVSHMLQVYPDLMGSAGVQLQSEQVHALESRHYRRFGPGGPAGG